MFYCCATLPTELQQYGNGGVYVPHRRQRLTVRADCNRSTSHSEASYYELHPAPHTPNSTQRSNQVSRGRSKGRPAVKSLAPCGSVIFVDENENGEKRENNEFVNAN